MTLPRSLDAKEIARILGVSRSRAYEIMRSMPHEIIGTAVRVREDDFDAWRVKTEGYPMLEERVLQPGQSHIYVIGVDAREVIDEAGERRMPFKIGFAKCLYTRLAAIQTANPYTIRLAALFFRRSSFESSLHARFAKHWVSGEWYGLRTDDVLDLQHIETRGERHERWKQNESLVSRRDRKGRRWQNLRRVS